MSFRARLLATVIALTLVTLGGAFTAVYVSVRRSTERQLDDQLEKVASADALHLASRGGLDSSPGPTTSHGVPLTRYEALYRDGRAVTASASFARAVPERASLPRNTGCCFDLRTAENLRAALVAVPGQPGAELLLGLPRTDLDSDMALLRRTMLIVFGVVVAWTAALAGFGTWWLTRGHRRITAVARRVAAGDLSARIGAPPGGSEVAQLARDIDDMIERLSILLASQQQFIAHAAHELRSPLAVLHGELSLALRRDRNADEYRRSIEEALDSSRRLKGLAEDLLALARLGATPPARDQRLSVPTLMDEARAAVDAAQVTLKVSGSCGGVTGTPGDLARLLRNLLENAARHSPPGGEILVELADEPGRVRISVSDRGPGVAEPDRERIFDPFYRPPSGVPRDGGAGLGLSIARTIARAHGGELFYQPREGGGASFVVELPA